MVLVRFLVPVAGLDWSRVPGDEVEMSEEDAVRWADGVRAVRVERQADSPVWSVPRCSRGVAAVAGGRRPGEHVAGPVREPAGHAPGAEVVSGALRPR
ncbi:hypothetical protein LX83_005003 [Goodfellowiella coeruleoviolacea]|uniref:Uncharacterized protein n=2 Tax=Goodfellowiella coeruleoviolacea TaxID=334858 RepID=A0AAE3GIV7_9PSEU|nr:hypothetical protein [Goodfellowiella coeruleoviolacea]